MAGTRPGAAGRAERPHHPGKGLKNRAESRLHLLVLTQFRTEATAKSPSPTAHTFLELLYFALAFARRPNTEAASRAVATTAPVATLATVRIGPDLLAAGFGGFAALAATLCDAPGTTFLGAALPKAGLASLAIVASSVAFDCLGWLALLLAGAGFLVLVAILRLPYAG
jgi:hypothetical protein